MIEIDVKNPPNGPISVPGPQIRQRTSQFQALDPQNGPNWAKSRPSTPKHGPNPVPELPKWAFPFFIRPPPPMDDVGNPAGFFLNLPYVWMILDFSLEGMDGLGFLGKFAVSSKIWGHLLNTPIEVEYGFSVVSGYLQCSTERGLLGIFSAALKIHCSWLECRFSSPVHCH